MNSRWEWVAIVILLFITLEIIILAYGAGIYMRLEKSGWKGVIGIDRLSQRAVIHYIQVVGKKPSIKEFDARWKEEIYHMLFDKQIKLMLFVWQYVR